MLTLKTSALLCWSYCLAGSVQSSSFVFLQLDGRPPFSTFRRNRFCRFLYSHRFGRCENHMKDDLLGRLVATILSPAPAVTTSALTPAVPFVSSLATTVSSKSKSRTLRSAGLPVRIRSISTCSSWSLTDSTNAVKFAPCACFNDTRSRMAVPSIIIPRVIATQIRAWPNVTGLLIRLLSLA